MSVRMREQVDSSASQNSVGSRNIWRGRRCQPASHPVSGGDGDERAASELTRTNAGGGLDVVESVESGEVSVMMKQASAKAEQGTTARKATRMLMKIKNSSGTKPLNKLANREGQRNESRHYGLQ